jgi:hypothetical protein
VVVTGTGVLDAENVADGVKIDGNVIRRTAWPARRSVLPPPARGADGENASGLPSPLM